MSDLTSFLIADHLTRARKARMCPEKHPKAESSCVLRWGHVSPHKTDRSERWQS